MARTARTANQIVRTGLTRTLTAVDAVNGEAIALVNRTMFLEVANGGGGSVDVTLRIARTVDGVTPDPKVVAVAAGATKMIGPFPAADYEQADGNLYVDYSSGTSVTAAAYFI